MDDQVVADSEVPTRKALVLLVPALFPTQVQLFPAAMVHLSVNDLFFTNRRIGI